MKKILLLCIILFGSCNVHSQEENKLAQKGDASSETQRNSASAFSSGGHTSTTTTDIPDEFKKEIDENKQSKSEDASLTKEVTSSFEKEIETNKKISDFNSQTDLKNEVTKNKSDSLEQNGISSKSTTDTAPKVTSEVTQKNELATGILFFGLFLFAIAQGKKDNRFNSGVRGGSPKIRRIGLLIAAVGLALIFLPPSILIALIFLPILLIFIYKIFNGQSSQENNMSDRTSHGSSYDLRSEIKPRNIQVDVNNLKDADAKRDFLLLKYDDEKIADGILVAPSIIGEPESTLRRILGDPEAILRQELKTCRKEIWKYYKTSGNRYALQIELKDGVVVAMKN